MPPPHRARRRADSHAPRPTAAPHRRHRSPSIERHAAPPAPAYRGISRSRRRSRSRSRSRIRSRSRRHSEPQAGAALDVLQYLDPDSDGDDDGGYGGYDERGWPLPPPPPPPPPPPLPLPLHQVPPGAYVHTAPAPAMHQGAYIHATPAPTQPPPKLDGAEEPLWRRLWNAATATTGTPEKGRAGGKMVQRRARSQSAPQRQVVFAGPPPAGQMMVVPRDGSGAAAGSWMTAVTSMMPKLALQLPALPWPSTSPANPTALTTTPRRRLTPPYPPLTGEPLSAMLHYLSLHSAHAAHPTPPSPRLLRATDHIFLNLSDRAGTQLHKYLANLRRLPPLPGEQPWIDGRHVRWWVGRGGERDGRGRGEEREEREVALVMEALGTLVLQLAGAVEGGGVVAPGAWPE
ncbi:hypothetical protein EDC01DRAFT_205599 [Geopyxis carbonaria]|nr:hypothetical protein EDC01DRAFT_205599 [Geopyxis carbonaria]